MKHKNWRVPRRNPTGTSEQQRALAGLIIQSRKAANAAVTSTTRISILFSNLKVRPLMKETKWEKKSKYLDFIEFLDNGYHNTP